MAKLLLIVGLIAAALASTKAVAFEVRTLHKPVANADASGTWTDLFSAPYSTCPSVMMAISCMDPNNCYVPAGSGPGDYQVMHFNGQPGGSFTPMQMSTSPTTLVAIDVRGDKNSPGGAVGGMGSLQYLTSNATTWSPSSIVNGQMDATQSIRASADGKRVLAVDISGNPYVWYSTTSGQSFSAINVTAPFVAEGTALRYGAIPTPNVWYVTAGIWPPNDSKLHDSNSRRNENSFALSSRVAVRRCPVTGKVTRQVRKIHNSRMAAPPLRVASSASGYAAQIFRTTDGGVTFTSVFADTTNFYFNGIDCIDVNHCYAVGEGFDTNAGVHIYRTTDGGNTWAQVYFLASTNEWSYSLMSIGVSQGTLIAAGGADGETSSQSLIITSADGITWTQSAPLPNIEDIVDLDVIAGGYAFAAATTPYGPGTILAFRPSTAPTLPPVPTQLTYTQSYCSNSVCSEGCSSFTYLQGTCIQFMGMDGSDSAIFTCTADALVQHYFTGTESCSGTANVSSLPINQCMPYGRGFTENTCVGPFN